jgi:hypothetical protein
MRRVLKQRVKRREAARFADGVQCPERSVSAPRLEEITALLARIDEMILGS